ncbi:MAG TPA: prephenate dehydrogenase/arogenate dehydrogenase family protein [Turneriella sp.]|nr:prephenate dehydrogenase/arogenate dehydrogenase family protein [Turneriella sp.]
MKVFIWGMGLIGASLGLRLKQAGYQVSGAVRSERSRSILQQMGFSDIVTDTESCLRTLAECDMLALGLNIEDCFPAIDHVMEVPALRDRLILLDMCSSKKQICGYMQQKYPDAAFVGCHPMAGKEKQGPEAAEATLFERSTVFLAAPVAEPSVRQRAAREAVAELWAATGARTAVVAPDEHDRIMAHVSHGLHLAACLIARLSGRLNTEALAASPAAGSYRDMTRIAESSGVMWNEITASNRDHVTAWLRDLAAEANRLADDLDAGKADIAALFAEASAARSRVMRK